MSRNKVRLASPTAGGDGASLESLLLDAARTASHRLVAEQRKLLEHLQADADAQWEASAKRERELRQAERELEKYVKSIIDNHNLRKQLAALREENEALRLVKRAFDSLLAATEKGMVDVMQVPYLNENGEHEQVGSSERKSRPVATFKAIAFDDSKRNVVVERETFIEVLLALTGAEPKKKCCRCQKRKPLHLFPHNRNAADGRFSSCLGCHRERMKESTRKRMNVDDVLPLFAPLVAARKAREAQAAAEARSA